MSPNPAWQAAPASAVDRPSRAAGDILGAAFDQLSGGRAMAFEPAEEIFGQGEPANRVYRILSGVVRVHRILADGRRQICDFLHPADVLGPEAGVLHAVSAEAVTPVTLQAVGRDALAARAAADVELAGVLWRLSIDWFNRARDHMLILARQGALERVAAFVLAYAERVGAVDGFDLPMTRQDIADYLGLTMHTVSRTLSQMCVDHLIDMPSQRRVRLNGGRRLEAMVT